VSEKKKMWILVVVVVILSLAWTRLSEAYGWGWWHALAVAAPLYAWGLVSHLRSKRKKREVAQ
jgi:hypothetical protein